MIKDEKCSNCPAIHLRTPEQLIKINKWTKLFNEQVLIIDNPKFILLGESFPPNRYIYDLNTSYINGLRSNLQFELGVNSGLELIGYLQRKCVLIYDCAYCPLCNLLRSAQKRHAATYCLKTYKLDFLNSYKASNAKIITFFPKNSGFIKRDLSNLQLRVIKEFPFNNLAGLKHIIS